MGAGAWMGAAGLGLSLGVGLVTEPAAWGVASAAAAVRTADRAGVVQAAVDQAAADREYVRWIARYDDRSIVRASGWNAVLSRRGDAAVAEWIATGYAAAVKRADTARSRNADFAERMLAVHPAEFWPNVNAAAQAAVNGTDAAREQFAKTGYAQAKERDRLALAAEQERTAALREADRDVVTAVRDGDPGANVRVAAALALQTGDAGVVEFLVHDWMSAARTDIGAHRSSRAQADVTARALLRRLRADAAAAAEAAGAAAGTAGEQQARQAAAAAFRAVGQQAAGGATAWAQAQDAAEAQAATWERVVGLAGAAGGENWDAVAQQSPALAGDWSGEASFAAGQAAFWSDVLAQAQATEQDFTAPAGPLAP